jgi:DNA polymerase-3 subunit epsilon
MAFRWLGKSADGMTITLKCVSKCIDEIMAAQIAIEFKYNRDHHRTGIVVDIETTGLNQNEDELIELGIRQFVFDRNSGEILKLGDTYSGLQDPGQKLSADVSRLTGLSDEELLGKHIDWDLVHNLFDDAAIVIAHNAKFDRPFVDRKLKISNQKIWACITARST